MKFESIIWVSNIPGKLLYNSAQWELARSLAEYFPVLIVAKEPRKIKSDLSGIWDYDKTQKKSPPTDKGLHTIVNLSRTSLKVLILEEKITTPESRTYDNNNIAYYAEDLKLKKPIIIHSGSSESAKELQYMLRPELLVYYNNRAAGSDLNPLTKDEKNWVEISQAIITRSEKHYNAFKQEQKKTSLLYDGVNTNSLIEANKAKRNFSKPEALYIGLLDGYFEYQLLADLSKKLNNWKFNLAGSISATKKSSLLNQRPNIRQLGPVNNQQLNALLSKAVVGIMPVKKYAEDHKQALIKLLAAGLPVVSACQSETEWIDTNLWQATEIDNWVTLLNDAPNQHSVEKRTQRYQIALTQNWEARAKELIKTINNWLSKN